MGFTFPEAFALLGRSPEGKIGSAAIACVCVRRRVILSLGRGGVTGEADFRVCTMQYIPE